MTAAPPSKKPQRKMKGDGQFERITGWWEVSEKWEVAYFICLPLVELFAFYQKRIGTPIHLRGLVFLIAVYYAAIAFLLMVVLDRRAEDRNRARAGAKWRIAQEKVVEIETAQLERRQGKARLEEAARRGREKAGQPPG